LNKIEKVKNIMQACEYFLPSTVQAWNDLPLPTRNLESLNSFKSLINTKNTNVPAHYYVGRKLGQILQKLRSIPMARL
jgi:hypothetical protein